MLNRLRVKNATDLFPKSQVFYEKNTEEMRTIYNCIFMVEIFAIFTN
jgi:hypothetical protein